MITTIVFALLLLQYPYPYPQPRRVPRGQNIPDTHGTITDAVATFDGKFKSADKKYITIEMEEGQTMRMYITSATKFFRDYKQVKASDFHTDDKVTVEASRDSRLNLLAVRVTATPLRAPDKPAAPQ
jgi:hypothetical protein